MKIRDFLFRGMEGCSNHGCVIKKPVGIGTNSICNCFVNASRSKLGIIQSRLSSIVDLEITESEDKKL